MIIFYKFCRKTSLRQKKLNRIILNRFTEFVYLLSGPKNIKKIAVAGYFNLNDLDYRVRTRCLIHGARMSNTSTKEKASLG